MTTRTRSSAGSCWRRRWPGSRPKQRAVLSLRFYEDLTEVQAAAVLGCSPNTVKSQTRQALERLRVLAPDLLASLVEEANR